MISKKAASYVLCLFLFSSHSSMLRLPSVGRALAGAAKGSLAPSNTGNVCECVCVYTSVFYVCVKVKSSSAL